MGENTKGQAEKGENFRTKNIIIRVGGDWGGSGFWGCEARKNPLEIFGMSAPHSTHEHVLMTSIEETRFCCMPSPGTHAAAFV